MLNFPSWAVDEAVVEPVSALTVLELEDEKLEFGEVRPRCVVLAGKETVRAGILHCGFVGGLAKIGGNAATAAAPEEESSASMFRIDSKNIQANFCAAEFWAKYLFFTPDLFVIMILTPFY